MSEQRLVSIIVPTCDRAEATIRCLDALIVQTYAPIEIVVIDDGSRDDTADRLDAFIATHPDASIVRLQNEQNLGANASRNRGVAAAAGELIAFLDSDCVAEPDWIEHLVRPFDDDEVGAVTGLVLDPPPRNVYDLTFRGTHRVLGPGPARRIVAGNLCVRQDILRTLPWIETAATPPRQSSGQPDTRFSGACDEEDLFLALKSADWMILAEPRARVLHEHYYDRASFYRQAYHGGRAAADLVRRRRLPHRTDMQLFMATYASLIPALAIAPWTSWWILIIPAAFLCTALAAILYNDLVLKGKTPGQALRSFPTLLVYYHVRLIGYVRRLGEELESRPTPSPPP